MEHGIKVGISVKLNVLLSGLGLRSDAIKEQFGISRKAHWVDPRANCEI